MSTPPTPASAGAAAEGQTRPARALPIALLVLAGPIIGSMVSRTLMSLVDFVMVSQLGTEPQAAIVPAGITLFTFIAFGMGAMGAVNTLVAQHFGRGQKPACAAYTWQGLWVSLALGGSAVALWPTIPALFAWAGHGEGVAALETEYVQIGLLGVGPTVAAVGVANFFNGIHRPMIGLWATVLSNLFNVVANYALIFGKLGFPELGMAGAAWATTAASVVNLLVLVAWWVRPRLAREYGVFHGWRPHRAQLAKLLKLGLPIGVHFAADIATFALFTLWLIGRFGTTELAANNIALKCFEVAIIPCVGMGVAVSSAVGRAIGEGSTLRARRFARWGNGMGLGYLAVVSAVYVFAGPEIIALLTDDADVARRAWHLLIVAMVFQAFDCTQVVYSSALRGAGDTLWPAVATPIAAVVVLIGGGYGVSVLWPTGGAVGPWLALTAYVIVLAALYVVRFRGGAWERLDVTEPIPATPEPAALATS